MSTTNVTPTSTGSVLGAATVATTGAVSLPFTGVHQPVSIIGLTAVVLGSIVLIVHFVLRIARAYAAR